MASGLTLRGARATEVSSVTFDIDLRSAAPVEDEQVEAVREAARSAGYAAGWAKGQQAARESAVAMRTEAELFAQASHLARAEALSRAVGAAAKAAEGLERRAVTAASEIEDLIITSAVELAQALLGRELSEAGERGLDAVRRALTLAPSSVSVTVRLHPTDHETLAGSPEVVADVDGGFIVDGRRIRVIADPSIGQGDAMAEYADTTIDASITAAMARVREVLAP